MAETATGLLFGTAGIPLSTAKPSTIHGIWRVAELGLSCMEIEFVQSVQMGEAKAREVAEAASGSGIRLSVHAPYYINLNAREPEKVAASQQRLLKAARMGKMCGASSVVFHAAFNMGDTAEQVYRTVRRRLAEVREQLDDEGNDIWIRPELMGRETQFGNLEDLLRLSLDLRRVAPCVDFAHWHARTGLHNTYPEFVAALSGIEERLGRSALENMHIHVAGIDYGPRGERKHLNLGESDMNYVDLMKALQDCGAGGLVVCESPNREEDALLLREAYEGLGPAG